MERDLVASVGFLSLRSLGVSGEPAVVLKRIKKSLETFGLEKRLDLQALLAGMTLDDAMRLCACARATPGQPRGLASQRNSAGHHAIAKLGVQARFGDHVHIAAQQFLRIHQ